MKNKIIKIALLPCLLFFTSCITTEIGVQKIEIWEKIEEKMDIKTDFGSSKTEKLVKKEIENKIWKKENMKNDKINMKNLKEAYFAGWCFWCMEWIFESQNWVSEAISWYIWWKKETATYSQVSSWKTEHREWVKIIYDPNIIKFEKLAELFWTQIDPTDPNGQFADKWFHYTTAMYFSNDEERKILEKSKTNLENSKKFDKKIVTKILKASEFFDAEKEHQDYYKKSSLRYNIYKIGSWRDGFIKSNWKNKIEKLEKNNLQNAEQNSEKIWYLDYSPEILKNAKQKNIILFFHADWCSTCVAFEKKVLSEKIPNDILILKVNYDTENDLRKKYNIITQTSFVLIDNKWELKKRWIWSRWIADIQKKINKFLLWKSEKSKIYTKEELKKRLTVLQYRVTQEWWTEPPFNNKYWDNKKEWIYVDIVDWVALFSSTDKYESGTGWPAFTKPIDENFIKEEVDYKLLVKRTEIKSDKSHLWHVFEDWPKDKWWLRYCINSAALDFIPKDKLKWTKYEKYLELFI